jgi:hypothetical protein
MTLRRLRCILVYPSDDNDVIDDDNDCDDADGRAL